MEKCRRGQKKTEPHPLFTTEWIIFGTQVRKRMSKAPTDRSFKVASERGLSILRHNAL